MNLEDIGFYTLSNARVKQVAYTSPMWRCEILVTDKCNFKCPYCQGVREDCLGTTTLEKVQEVITYWTKTGLRNIRFSGGEPTLHPDLAKMVEFAKKSGVERIAISTNGSASISYYNSLIESGTNDFSISLDACCSSFGQKMCGGISGAWEQVVENIKELSKRVYVSLGMVFTSETIEDAIDIIKFGNSLGVADIRIISAAQDNKIIPNLYNLNGIINNLPILKYRINNYLNGRNVRGICQNDSNKCGLVLDDSAVAGNYHFPCIIYLREKGNPIGKIGPDMRKERFEWYKTHNSYDDKICRENCLDVCIDYNNKFREIHGG